jgi:hypothetical protein
VARDRGPAPVAAATLSPPPQLPLPLLCHPPPSWQQLQQQPPRPRLSRPLPSWPPPQQLPPRLRLSRPLPSWPRRQPPPRPSHPQPSWQRRPRPQRRPPLPRPSHPQPSWRRRRRRRPRPRPLPRLVPRLLPIHRASAPAPPPARPPAPAPRPAQAQARALVRVPVRPPFRHGHGRPPHRPWPPTSLCRAPCRHAPSSSASRSPPLVSSDGPASEELSAFIPGLALVISLPLALALSVVTKLVETPEKAAMEWPRAARVAAGPPSGALSFLWAARYQGAMS